jgi:hypothetical protein
LRKYAPVDADFLRFLMQHSSGLDLIPAPEGGDMTRELPPEPFLKRSIATQIRIHPGRPPVGFERGESEPFVVTPAVPGEKRGIGDPNVVRQTEYLTRADIPRKDSGCSQSSPKRNLIDDAQIEGHPEDPLACSESLSASG